MKHCLVFDTVFHHQMKHLEVRQKYFAARRIFNSLLGVSSGDQTLRLMLDILHKKNAIPISAPKHTCELRGISALHMRTTISPPTVAAMDSCFVLIISDLLA